MTKNKNGNTKTSSKKRWLKPTVWIVLFAIVLNFYSSFAVNSIAQAALNPTKYYQKVEKDNLNKQIDQFTKNYAEYMSSYQNALKKETGSYTTVEASINPLISESMGLEGLEDMKATIISMSKENIAKSSMIFSVNDNALTTMDIYSSLEGLSYLLIPDLSKAYLKMSMNELDGYDDSLEIQKDILDYINNPMSEEVLNSILKKYTAIAIDQVNNVTMKENESITVEDITSEYTRLTARINEKTALNITNAILVAAKSDKELKELFVDLGICTSREYDLAIKELMNDVADELKELSSNKTNGKDIITMTILVDDKGNIAGRRFKLFDAEEALRFGYQTTKDGNTIGVEAWINSAGKDVLRGTGKLTGKLSGITGDIELTYSDSYSNIPQVFNISVKDLKYTLRDSIGFINGEISLTGNSLNGMEFKIKCTGDISKQDIVFDVIQYGESLATITTSAMVITFQDFSVPSSEDIIYDFDTELEEYIINADIKGFLHKVKMRSDVKAIDDYIDSLLTTFVE